MMIEKPEQFAPAYAAAFQDRGVVEAYRYRPPYPAEVFDILVGLIEGGSGTVLDVGCGTGNIARPLVEHVERVDAVDFSRGMIAQGRLLPSGDHLCLRWIHGRVEDAPLDPPYALVTAGESVHWMDWNVALPRFREVLRPGGSIALVTHDTLPDPWSMLGAAIPRYRTDAGYRPYDVVSELERHGLFEKRGERETTPVPWAPSIDDYIESYHSRGLLAGAHGRGAGRRLRSGSKTGIARRVW